MDYSSKKTLHLPGTLSMFILTTVVAVVLSCVYIVILSFLPSIYISIFAAVAYGAIMIGLCRFLCYHLKVTNKILTLLFVFLALIIAAYVKWAFWAPYINAFMISDGVEVFDSLGLLFEVTWYGITHPAELFKEIMNLNKKGTWSYEGTDVNGTILLVIWIGEFLIMNIPVLWASVRSKNVFIYEENAWAKPTFIPIAYDAFEDHEIEALHALHFDPVVAKQPTLKPSANKTFRLAFMKVNGNFTGYVGIYKMTRQKNNNLQESIVKNPIYIGVDGCIKLDAMFSEKLAPQPSEIAAPTPSPAVQTPPAQPSEQMDWSFSEQPAPSSSEHKESDKGDLSL